MTLFDIDEGRPEPARPTVRVAMVVAYDGSRFAGFAAQPGQRTVAGTISAALEPVVGHRVTLTCAGRTDRGVHAWGQVVSFDVAAAHADPDMLARTLNRRCRPAVAVRHSTTVDSTFDARFSARSRVYRYTVWNAPVHDPFRARTAWHVPHPLDPALLTLACDPFIGEHDFSAFCRRPRPRAGEEPPSLRRRVLSASWSEPEPWVRRLEIEAVAFCHQMVRSIVGTLVAAGRGRIRPGEISAVLASGDRARAAPVAPPEGLCLWRVRYEGLDGELRPCAGGL